MAKAVVRSQESGEKFCLEIPGIDAVAVAYKRIKPHMEAAIKRGIPHFGVVLTFK